MQTTFKIIFTLLLALQSVLALTAQGIQFEADTTTWATILAKAKAENKLIFVDCYTSWCAPCKMMEKEIFPQKAVGDWFNMQFVSVQMDMEKGDGIKVGRLYKVNSYPTYLFFDTAGTLVHRAVGRMDAEQFIAVGKAAIVPELQCATLKSRYEAGERSAKFLKNLIIASESAKEDSLITVVIDAYVKTQKKWENKADLEFILDHTTNIDQTAFTYLLQNRATFEDYFGANEVEHIIDMIAFYDVGNTAFVSKAQGFDLAKARMFANLYFSPEFADEIVSRLDCEQSKMQHDTVQYLKKLIAHTHKFPPINPCKLGGAAYQISEYASDTLQLRQGVEWFLQAHTLCGDYKFLKTGITLYSKLKDWKNARIYADLDNNPPPSRSNANAKAANESDKVIKSIMLLMRKLRSAKFIDFPKMN